MEKLLDSKHVDHIDLNFGCPVPKVTKHGGGGALPYKQTIFRSIVKSVVHAADGEIPVTVKFSMGIDDNHLTYLDAGKIAEDEGVAAISLHARTVEQLYSGHADWLAIRELKHHIKSIPIFGNGDIDSSQKALSFKNKYGIDGIMIGRAAIGYPWIFNEIKHFIATGNELEPPSISERVEVAKRHLKLSLEWKGERLGIFEMRRHYTNYFKSLCMYIICTCISNSTLNTLITLCTYCTLSSLSTLNTLWSSYI